MCEVQDKGLMGDIISSKQVISDRQTARLITVGHVQSGILINLFPPESEV